MWSHLGKSKSITTVHLPPTSRHGEKSAGNPQAKLPEIGYVWTMTSTYLVNLDVVAPILVCSVNADAQSDKSYSLGQGTLIKKVTLEDIRV